MGSPVMGLNNVTNEFW